MQLQILQGDITTLETEVIVNAANTSLMGGGGVDGAIHRKGGPAILEECIAIRNRQGNCKVGEAVITTAGKLPAKYVVHTVGPVWNGGKKGEPELLKNCYLNSIKLAIEHGMRDLNFPGISTGIYRYPKQAAAELVFEFFKTLPLDTKKQLGRIGFVCFDQESFDIYKALHDQLAANSLSTLIVETPVGLRGDPYLWTAFKEMAATIEIPTTAEVLSALLLDIFKTLVGQYPQKGKFLHVGAFSHGGMSSGMIDCDTWLEQGFPAIMEAFVHRQSKN